MKVSMKTLGIGAGLLAFYGAMEFGIRMGFINDFFQLIIFLIGMNIILATSLNLINGFTGQFSIGHAGFMAIGAYVSAVLTVKFAFPFFGALIIGGLAAAFVGLLIGIPTLRLKGDYLAIATLGLGEIIRISILNINYVGGASGFMGIPQYTNWTWVFFVTAATVIIIRNFLASTHGRACISIRENEIAAEAMGINTTKYKVMAFTIGSFFAGISGALFSHYFFIAHPTSFTFLKSVEVLIFVVLGGLGSLTGSIVAAIFVTVLFAVLQPWPELRMSIFALVLIITMIYRPSGLMGNMEITDLFKKFKKEEGDAGGIARG